MFNKKNNDFEEQVETTTENITTIIAEDCTIEGGINSRAYIKIDGQALGGVVSGGIVLGQKGFIKGDATAKEVVVYGKIEGNIFADNLILKPTAVISGNIKIKSFQVEFGAKYKGSVEMDTGSGTSYSVTPVDAAPKETKKPVSTAAEVD